MRVIFLDIDGVLNSTRTMIVWGSGLVPFTQRELDNISRDDVLLDPVAVDLLRLLTEASGAKIVISSTWRLRSSPTAFHKMFDLYGWDTRDIVIGLTPVLHHKRGDEIASWLKDNPVVEQYVILDDDSDMLVDQLPNFVNTEHDVGFARGDFEKAIGIFGMTLSDVIKYRNSLDQ